MRFSSGTMRRVKTLKDIKTRYFMFKRLMLVVLLGALDIRDLYYKVVLQGPVDTFSFSSGSTSYLENKPLISAVTQEQRDKDLATSGWSSFLSRCDELTTFVAEGSTFFLMVRATNCHTYTNSTVTALPPLVFISAVRVDSLAWAACHLLHLSRRPPVCGDTMVINFNKRYGFDDTPVEPELMAPVGSAAENELIRFLDFVGVSYPLHKLVCVESFPLLEGERGIFTPSVYGCASPNEFRAEFVGFQAKGMHHLQHPKGWLTEDALTIFTSRYGIRQNCKSNYAIADAEIKDATGAVRKTISIRNITTTNFGSHGLIYAIVVIFDLLLFLTHGLSLAELYKWIKRNQYYQLQRWILDFDSVNHDQLPSDRMVPEKSGRDADTLSSRTEHRSDGSAPPFDETELYGFFPKSFYRSNRYRAMLLTTRILSWVIVVPNSVTWTWSDSLWMKFQAYLCSIKSWVLVATAFNWLWRGLVRVREPLAYQISRRTHLNNQEIIAISSLAALLESSYIFSICEQKWQIEHQRVNDVNSFPGYIAHGNTFQRSEESTIFTPWKIVWIIYEPLVRIIGLSVLMIAVWLAIKAAGYAVLGMVSGSYKTIDPVASGKYARLPLEKILDSPIRALSIVRYQLSMEVVKDGKLYVRPSCYLDYGVMLKTVEPKRAPPVTNIFKRPRAKVYVGNTATVHEE